MILPFVDDAQPFTFADGIDSIGVSGHKMIGSPIPCGIVVAKKENVDRISVEIDYISAHDKTITGSRNGHTPLMLWEAIRSHSTEEWKRRITRSLDMAQYAVDRMQKAGINAWRNKTPSLLCSLARQNASGRTLHGNVRRRGSPDHHRAPSGYRADRQTDRRRYRGF